MLTAVSGSLVSEYFARHLLADRFAGRLGEHEREAARRALGRLCRTVASLGPASSVRAIFDVGAVTLADLLGFRATDVRPRPDRARGASSARRAGVEDAGAPVLEALLEHDRARVVLLTTVWGCDLDTAWHDAVRAGIHAGVRWCLLFNARRVRLVDSARSYSREYLEFDLEGLADEAVSFELFWATLRAEAFAPYDRPLLDDFVRLSAEHAVGVCRSLQDGVLDAIGALMQGFVDARAIPLGGEAARSSPLPSLFEQSLTIVYRVLFLLFAEARRLVPVWHRTYADAYSIETLRAAVESAGPHGTPGVWEGLRAISRLAHRGCRAGSLIVTPFNGRLFSPARTPLAESARLDDGVARRVIIALSTESGRAGRTRERITYRDLGVEQLGAVYEGVLDYEPRLVPASEARAADAASCHGYIDASRRPRTRRHTRSSTGTGVVGERRGPVLRVRLDRGSARRKATGTFYTPHSLTGYLVRRTLHPLVEGRTADEILDLRVLDPAMGSGAFLVAACRYLASCYERALVGEGRPAADVDERDRALFRGLVAQRCLFGVDVNPMAVQLARLSLWLATLSADRPLTFLDHHLGVGDSLVGASPLDVLRYPGARSIAKPPPGDRDLFEAGDWRDDVSRVVPERRRVALEPGDTLAAVRDKERTIERLARADAPLGRWRQVADLWCACWFWDDGHAPSRGTYFDLVDALVGRRAGLPARTSAALLERARQVARARRFFHWPIEFPEVCSDNPASGAPGFDAVVGNPPWDMLRADDRVEAQDKTYDRALVNFARRSHLYRAQGDGHPNRFQLFVERAFHLVRPGGRLGLVVPWGLLSDRGCRHLRRLLFDRADTDTVVGFDNTKRIFPIHRSLRFALLTATTGRRTERTRCRFGEKDLAVLDSLPGDLDSELDAAPVEGDAWYPIVLSPSLLRRVSGDDLAVPDVRSAADLEIVAHASERFPALGAPRGWGARFGRELNASDDRPHLTEEGGGLPVLEGKHVEPFVADVSRARLRVPMDVAERLLDGDASFRRARLAYRDVASATNRLTLIAAVLPSGCVTTHTLFCLKTALDDEAQWFLCGVMNSYVLNYLVRLRVTTHVSAGIVECLPVPRVPATGGAGAEVARLARRLSAAAPAAAGDRLQAEVARLYALTARQFAHVLSTFPLVDEERRRGAFEEFGRGVGR